MIKTVAEFLQSLAENESQRLNEQDIKHPGVIGSMYEGLTKNLLNKALPQSLDLRVVDGFVTDGLGGMSGQIDCMLVRGEGEAVPYVDGTYKWHVRDVIAVFEVKKNLFGADLSDAYDQLKSVSERFSAYIQEGNDRTPINLEPTEQYFAQLTGRIAPPPDRWRELPMEQHLMIHSIMFDQLAPARIAFGYGGYKTEASLRKGFLDYLGEKFQVLGYGPPSIPHLITANGNSLVKMTGHPYLGLIDEEERWPIVGSTKTSPLLLLLEIIWTRLSYIESHPEVFGDDLEIEKFNRLLTAWPRQVEDGSDRWGWMYYSVEANEAVLGDEASIEPWSPVVFDHVSFTILQQLCNGTEISATDDDLEAFASDHGQTAAECVQTLIASRLVALEGDRLLLTTFECACVILPDGRYIAGENNTGRLSRWVDNFMAAYHAQKTE
ncbi:MAG: DUF6602 domain-containing protein [Pseudomonadota bacterium]